MGEVRVAVKLTNAVDEALVRRGMMTPEQVRTYEADALVDTGAVRMVVPPEVATRLGLGVRGQRMAEYADGRTATACSQSGAPGSAVTKVKFTATRAVKRVTTLLA
jgi:predicted aspartyl protease